MRNKLIYAILSLLGLATACSKHHDGEDICMYGTPFMTFSTKGHVADEKGQPIEGIRVSVCNDNSTFTDAQGQFVFNKRQAFGMGVGDRFVDDMEFRDVDGEENGSFETQKIPVFFVRTEEATTSMWHYGDYRSPDNAVVLRAKSTPEEEEKTE